MRIDEMLNSSRPVFSVEFFPPKTEEGRQTLFETVEVLRKLDPHFFSVTYGAGGATREGTLDTTRAIRDQYDSEAMAHLSCVGRDDREPAGDHRPYRRRGIENILALRGDPPRGEKDFEQPEGGLGSASDLAALIHETHPEIAIGGACFPEVHPEAPSLEADLAYLKTKIDNGVSFLITQLFYDNQLYFDFVPAARAAGIDVPIIPGIMPMTGFKQIAQDLGALPGDDPGSARLCDARRSTATSVPNSSSASPTRPSNAPTCCGAALPASTSTRSTARPRRGRSLERCTPPSPGRTWSPRRRPLSLAPRLSPRCLSSNTTATRSPTTSTERATGR